MFKFNRVTRTFRNQDNGQNRSSAPAFNSGSDPFSQSGSNIFHQMRKGQESASNTDANLQAPTMSNGMPNGTNGMPNGQQPQGQQQGQPQQSNIVPSHSNTSQNAGTNQQSVSPLDKYNKKPDNGNQGGEPQQAPANQQQAPAAKTIFDTDMKGWQGAMKNVDLTAGIDPENVQKALAGDANSFMEIIQQVSRTAMENAAFMSLKASGSGFDSGQAAFGKTIPDMITSHKFDNMWQGDSVMNHESAQPMVQAMTQTLRSQYPQATPQEIQQHVQQYFQTFSQSLNGQQEQAENKEPEVNTSDIGNFFNRT